MDDIVAKRLRDRFKYLHHVYEVTRGSTMEAPDMEEIGAAIGLDAGASAEVAWDLMQRGLLKSPCPKGAVQLSQRGAAEVEDAVAHPQRGTQTFPPAVLNILTIQGDVHGSQIQQGTTGSTQRAGTDFDVSPLLALVAEIRAVGRGLLAEQHEQLETDLSTIELQAKARQPKWSIIRESLSSARNITEGAIGGTIGPMLVAKIIAMLADVPQ